MDDKVLKDIVNIINHFDPQSGGGKKRKPDNEENDNEEIDKRNEKKQKTENVAEEQYRESRLQYIKVCNIVAHVVAGILMITGMSGIYYAFGNTFDINVIISNFANIIRTSSGLLSSTATAVQQILSSAFSGMGVQFATLSLIQHSRQSDKSLLENMKNGVQSGVNIFDYGIDTTRAIKNKFFELYRGSIDEFDTIYYELQVSIANSLIDCKNNEFNEEILREYLVPLHEWLINGDFIDTEENPVASSSCDVQNNELQQIMNEVQKEIKNDILNKPTDDQNEGVQPNQQISYDEQKEEEDDDKNKAVQSSEPMSYEERKEEENDNQNSSGAAAAVKKKKKKTVQKKKSIKKKKSSKKKSKAKRNSIKRKR